MKRKGNWVVVVAAGRGERAGLPYNKVFYPLAGRSVLSRCFDRLEQADCFEGAVLVLSEADRERYRRLTFSEGAPLLARAVVTGGENRQSSVYRGLRALSGDAEIVSIHDAARAFVAPEVILDTLQSARAHGSGVAATLLSDTVKRVDARGLSVETLDRSVLRAVQTPQSFQVPLILRAHEAARRDGWLATDDAALMERYVAPVRLCYSPGTDQNLKLTTMEDIQRMEARMTARTRVGFGYDAHRFAEGRPLVLCGVEIPFERGLLGHSDADAACHALMDALLGAAALGDIGRHFPDTDDRYRGARSVALLEQVRDILASAGYRPGNVDVTIVAEKPKIAPFVDRMRCVLARALRISDAAVSVKATSTEGLGFEGRAEGISANAVAAIVQG